MESLWSSLQDEVYFMNGGVDMVAILDFVH